MSNKFMRVAILLAVAFLPFTVGCRNKFTKTDPNKVIVWHWMTDRDEAFQELARRYNEETGGNVQFQLYAPSDVYTQKTRVGAQTNSLPEIFGVLGDSRDMASFIEAGHIENLTEALGNGPDSWKESFYEEALNTVYFNSKNAFNVPEGYYGVPIDVTTIPMIYNKNLFKKAGISGPPKTWDDFILAGQKLKKIGVNGFVSGWGETWLIYSLATDLAHNLMGEAKVMDTFRGKVSYTDSDWVTVLGAFEKLKKAGFSDASLVTMGNKEAEQKFSKEEAGMTFNGSWAVNVYSRMNPDLDYAPFSPPSLGNKFPQTVWGGAGSMFLVNGKSENKEAAVNFLRWLSDKEQAEYLVEKTRNLSAIKNVGGSVAPVLAEFSQLMKNSTHPNRFAVSEDPRVQEALTKGIQSILIGEKSVTQVAADIQKAKEKSLRQE